LTGNEENDYDGRDLLAFFLKNNGMDFFSYLVHHPNPNEIYNAKQDEDENAFFFVKQNLASEPSLLMYTSFIQQTVSDLIDSFKFQPSTITRSISHNFVMRANQTIDLDDWLFYQINPCESLTPFVFTAHAASGGLNIGMVFKNNKEMGSWKGKLGINGDEPFVYPGRGIRVNWDDEIKLYQDVDRYYPSHQFSPDLACENAFLGRVSFNLLDKADWMMFRVTRFAMFRNPMAAMKVGFNVIYGNGYLGPPMRYTQGWRSDGAYADIFDSNIQLSSSKGVDALAAKTYVAAQAGVTSANLNLPMVNPVPRIPEKEYLTYENDDRVVMQTVLVLKVRVLYNTVFVKVMMCFIHVTLMRSNFVFLICRPNRPTYLSLPAFPMHLTRTCKSKPGNWPYGAV
jgi:hypothetical protein